MKTFKLFSMAAIALMMGACSSDDNVLEQQPAQQQGKIPFSATISGANVTRTVIEEGTGSDAGKLVVAWKGDEVIALVHNGKKEVVTVSKVNTDGSAVITGSIDAAGTDGEAVVLVYPAAAVKSVTSGTTFVPNTDAAFLAPGLAQDGTLAYIGTNHLDGREGSGTLKISGGKATLSANVDMVSKAAIWELNLTTDGTTPIAAKTVTLKVGTQPVAGGAYASGKSKYYLCVVPKTLTALYTLTPTAAFTIEASDGTNTYTYTKTSALSLSTGTFYQSTLTMAAAVATGHELSASVVGEVVGTDGLAYDVADKGNLPTGVTAAGMVAYKSGTTGLVIALADEASTMVWSTANGATTGAAAHTPAVTGQAWKLPSQDEWKQMFSANGGNENSCAGLNTAIGNAGGTALQNSGYWSSTENSPGVDVYFVDLYDGDADWYNNDGSGYYRVRACLAF